MTDSDIQHAISVLTHWKLHQGKLVRKWTFATFSQAISFVNEVAMMAEAADHHPNIDIRYKVVRLSLVTHSAGRITQRDIDFAGRLDT